MANSDSTTRKCSSCNQVFPLTAEYFGKNKSTRTGFIPYCKPCWRKISKTWRDKNPEKSKEIQRKHYKANPQQHKDATRAWKVANREYVKGYKRDWYKNNPDKVKVMRDKRYAKDKDAIKQLSHEYRLNNHETVLLKDRARNKKRYQENPVEYLIRGNKRRALKANAVGNHTESELRQLYADQECRCGYCGMTIYWGIPGDIHEDHVIALSSGGSNSIDNIVLTCAFCNLSKGARDLATWQVARGW